MLKQIRESCFLVFMKNLFFKTIEEAKKVFAPLASSTKAVAVVVSSLVILLLYIHQGSADFFEANLGKIFLRDQSPELIHFWAVIYQHASAFVLFLVLPLFFLKVVKKRKVQDFGLGVGDWKIGFLIVAPLGVLLLSVPAAFLASFMPDFVAEYPLTKLASIGYGTFVFYELVYGFLYYAAYEGFFRGILQFSLAKHIGIPAAILMQTAITTLLHIGKPQGEIWSALFAGLLFGALAFRLKSIWPLWIIHFSLGLFTDLFCSMIGR